MRARKPHRSIGVSIPDPDIPGLEAFLEARPEERERIEEARRRDREMRDFAEVVIRDIYSHYTTASPSQWGLGVTVRSFLRLMEDENAEVRRREAGDAAALADEIGEVRARLADDPRKVELERNASQLLEVADTLLGELDDARVALTTVERIGRYEAQRARADALRAAAGLVRGGAAADELDRRAAEAEPTLLTLDEIAAQLGIDLGPPDIPEETE